MHPNVESDIDADLDIMRLGVHLMEKLPLDFMRNLKWLDLPGIIDDMEVMLKIQLDLRREAYHLERFNENFKDSDLVQFPEVCFFSSCCSSSPFFPRLGSFAIPFVIHVFFVDNKSIWFHLNKSYLRPFCSVPSFHCET